MDEATFISILLDSLSENQDTMKEAEQKLISLASNQPELILLLASNILNSDNREIKVYNLSLIAIKNTLLLLNSKEQQKYTWSEVLSEQTRENVKQGILRGTLIDNPIVCGLAGACAQIIFAIDPSNFNIFEYYDQILQIDDYSDIIKESILNSIKDIFDNDIKTIISKTFWLENTRNLMFNIFQTMISLVKNAQNHSINLISSVFHLLHSIIDIMKNELNTQQSQEAVIEAVNSILPIVMDIDLYSNVHEFLQQYVLVFNGLRWNEIPRVAELIEIGIESSRSDFVCVSLDFWCKISDYEKTLNEEKCFSEKFHLAKEQICSEFHFTREIKDIIVPDVECCTKLYCKQLIPKILIILQNSVLYGNQNEEDLDWNVFEHAATLLKKLMWCFSSEIYEQINDFILESRRNPKYYYSVILILSAFSSCKDECALELIENNLHLILDYSSFGVAEICQIALKIVKSVSEFSDLFTNNDQIQKTIEIILSLQNSQPIVIQQCIDCLSTIVSRVSDLFAEQFINSFAESIFNFISFVISREDCLEHDLVRKSYEIFEEIIKKCPENMPNTIESLYSSTFEQLTCTINDLAYEGIIPYFIINECLLHLITQIFRSFPNQMKPHGIEFIEFISQFFKDASSPLFKAVLDTILAIILSIGLECQKVMNIINNMLSHALQSKSPEITQQGILLLKIITQNLPPESFDDSDKVVKDLIDIISDSEMVLIAPLSLNAIAQIMSNIPEKITDEMVDILINKTIEMCNIDLIQDIHEIEFRSEAFSSLCTIGCILLSISSQENVSARTKTIFDQFKFFKNFYDYDVNSLNCFCLLVRKTINALGKNAQRLVTRIPVFMFLILATMHEDDELCKIARSLFEECTKI
ncbi:hypothetical protein TVAG_353460 [Trichomonas vaginalis G3]|uniref:Importin N-terminal domain-containing protein n=1 Tax=Trichomonas vaginalis (strain ATCC PRA-98 / G3) TaxID=412133 RepID=A2EN68_TRIV3|nr:importin beta family [Trichomonas vaginalis G3]EAY05905.1 hypothetical protein TVAG_353460 [Trichomonas vaginalis G3]KAI5520211.1 importin beta family [Trichomonas vaginalis G3]|eukprot:XP_001318128.1 hypothetical protein [Trichomonas vaginalis G3]